MDIPVTSSILIEKANEFAQRLDKNDFKCNTGWLDRFKTRHSIVFKKICGEANSVTEAHFGDWYSTISPAFLIDHKSRAIYNADETGLFWRLLLDKTLTFKDVRRNDALLGTFKETISRQENLISELQNVLKSKSGDISSLNEELRNVKSRLEKTEANLILTQKENNRFKGEMEIKKEIEAKQKVTIDSLKTDVFKLDNDLKAEKKKCVDLETKYNSKTSDDSSNAKRLIEDQMKAIAAADLRIEALIKEHKAKDGQIETLNHKLLEKDKGVSILEKNFAKLDADYKNAILTKERQLDIMKQQKEAITSDNLRLKLEKSALEEQIENRSKDKANVEKDKIASLPPTGKRRGGKSYHTEDDTNEVELTPMVSKRMAQNLARQSREPLEMSESFDGGSKAPTNSRKLTSLKSSRTTRGAFPTLEDKTTENVENTVGQSIVATASTVPVEKSARKNTRKKKTSFVTDEDISPSATKSRLAPEELLSLDTPYIEKLTSGDRFGERSDRPSRRAKATARNGIFAVTEYLRNSPGASTSSVAKKEEFNDDFSDQSLPLKKRKRNLFKSPENVVLSPNTPPT
uniref:HTH CENPB-type domain-containing protein n=1 Tax=Romanomermis culicivorax TaxID=13658 RepID=A0A915HSL7_ROMCU